MRQMLRCY